MTAASGDHHTFDRSLAYQARFAFPPVNAMLELEKSFLAVGIHIVRNGRSSESDRFFQHFPDREEELAKLLTSNRRRFPPRTDAGAE